MIIRKIEEKKKGFTLIELMVVISILLVLMGFMIPKFSAYQDKAKTIKAINTAKQVQTAVMASYGDNDGKFEKTVIEANIDDLTLLNSTNKVSATVGANNGQDVKITYENDGKNYIMDINASENTYTVQQDNIQIYPKIQKKDSVEDKSNEQKKIEQS